MKKNIILFSLFLYSFVSSIQGKCCNPNQNCNVQCPVLPILSVPFVVPQSGHYLVPRSLTYAGSGSAITVDGLSNVTIEFCDGAQITATNSLATGIEITDATNVDILNAALVGTLSEETTSRGISVTDSSNITIQHASITNSATGILLFNAENIDIGNLVSVVDNGTLPTNSHVRVRSSNNVTLHDSQFRSTSAINSSAGGIVLQDTVVDEIIPTGIPCKAVSFRNLECYNTDIFAPVVDGFIAENITSVIEDPEFIFSMFQLGTTATLEIEGPTPNNANNVILRNSSFINKNANDTAIGVQITQGQGILVDNIVVNCDAAGTENPDACQDPNFSSGVKLAIGNTASSECAAQVIDCVVRNSVFTSITQSGYGITILGTPAIGENPPAPNSGVIIDNCLVSDCSVDGILIRNSIGCSIQNSNVQGCVANGIHLDVGAFTNSILNNVVSANDGNGITIEDGSTENHLQNNKVYNNDGVGINNLDATTEIYYNTSCNNGTNCVGVFPSNNPGDPSVVGENICCELIPG